MKSLQINDDEAMDEIPNIHQLLASSKEALEIVNEQILSTGQISDEDCTPENPLP